MSPDVDFPSDLRSLEREYELIRELGQGGMAAVYLARQRSTGRLVAIKAIRARYLDDPDAVRRFAREARTVAGLDHPNIVRTESIEQFGDRAVAIIMEHVPGGTVRDRLREFGSLGAEDAESILRDVANALGYAHRRGIVHRDVKPENIFLDATRRRALLSDFGIARPIDTDAGITLLGAALGTPQYMSPEQIDGEVVDGRSDIYSLGVLGWELLTGRRPWAGESLYGIIYKQKHEDLPRITSLRPRVPANLLFAIEGALVKDKKRRWQTIDDFLDQLTYNPPPILSQTFPPGPTRGDYERTVEFRRESQPAQGGGPPPEREVARAAEPESPETSLVARDVTATATVPPHAAASAPTTSGDITPGAATGATEAASDFDADAASSFRFPTRRRRIVQVIGLLLPLGVAAASLFILLSGSVNRLAPHRGGSDRVTSASSSGSVASESIGPVGEAAMPPGRDGASAMTSSRATGGSTSGIVTGSSTAAARPSATVARRPVRRTPMMPSAGVGSSSTAPTPGSGLAPIASSHAVTGVRPPDDSAATVLADAGDVAKRTAEPIEDPFRIPASAREPTALGAGSPSPRCRLAAAADQNACLTAYIATGDISLNRAFESLVDELRRVARTPPGAPDPATVRRIRLEQRAWIAIRDGECPRHAPMGAGPFWAQAQATCFAEMARARTNELRDAVKRLERSRH